MEFREKGFIIARAKEMDMVSVLSPMGFETVRVRGNDHWYNSPLRVEKTPSFKINRKLNRWYDHGIGKGGNLVDFAVLFWGCSVAEALQKLAGDFSFQQHPVRPVKNHPEEEKKIKILSASTLSSPALFMYLRQRYISPERAKDFCCQVRYEIGGRTVFGIGFKNDLGGYEIRNAFHKLSSSPKAITSIKNGSDHAAVFEGFFDFLSYVMLIYKTNSSKCDFLILNSLAFFQGIAPVLAGYRNVYLFLDNDAAGKEAARLALSWDSRYQDKSNLYEGYEDLNEWLVDAGQQAARTFKEALFVKEKPPDCQNELKRVKANIRHKSSF